jgi:hypothetical protein
VPLMGVPVGVAVLLGVGVGVDPVPLQAPVDCHSDATFGGSQPTCEV